MVYSSSQEDGRYNISVPPRQHAWKSVGQPCNEQYLTVDNVPVNFWIVGRVAEDGAWLVGPDDDPFRFVSLRMRPILPGDYEKWKVFLNHLGGQTGS